jgi:branched-chain amino acid transport system permease protein
MIENLLQVAATSDPRALNGGALAGVFIGTIGTFDPLAGTNTLIFAFEAVVIGGIGSLWGTLVGGMALGITQVVVGEVNQSYAVLAVHLLFLAVLTVRPGGLFTGHQEAREVRDAGVLG